MITCGITTYNRADLLGRCLRQYAKNCCIPTRFIIYQDGSKERIPDGVINSHLENSPHSLISNTYSAINRVLAYGRKKYTESFLKTDGKFLLHLDDDAEVKPGGIETLLDILTQQPSFGMAGGSNYRNSNYGILNFPFVAGFCWMMTRACLDKIGNFDEGAGYRDDADMYIRAWIQGFTPVCTKINVKHKRMHDDPSDPQCIRFSEVSRGHAIYLANKYPGLLKAITEGNANQLRRTKKFPSPPKDFHWRFDESGTLVKVPGPAPSGYVPRSATFSSRFKL